METSISIYFHLFPMIFRLFSNGNSAFGGIVLKNPGALPPQSPEELGICRELAEILKHV